MNDIELIGGGLRVPKIQEFIQDSLNGTKPNQKLNQDEASTFGAGFLAASLSTSFKVRPIHIAHQAPFEFSVKISGQDGVVYEGVIMHKHEEYHSPLALNLTAKGEIRVDLLEDFEGEKRIIHSIKVQSAGENMTLEFVLNRFGILELAKAFYVQPEVVQRNISVNGTIEERIQREVKLNFTSVEIPKRMDESEFAEGTQKLDALDTQEANIRARAQAKNQYESLIYSGRDWLKDDSNQKYIVPEVKQALLEFLDTV